MIDRILSTATGALGWALSEHVIHQNLGHKYAKNRNFFAVEHTRHHATTSYFAPSWKKAAVAGAVATAMAPAAVALGGRRRGLGFTAGYVGAYVTYEVLHRFAHTRPPKTRYGRWLRRHHFHHHFHDPKVNHGVTSPLLDHLFGTHEPPGRIRVPERHAMPWLVDPATGEVRPEHAGDYELVRKNRKRPGGAAA